MKIKKLVLILTVFFTVFIIAACGNNVAYNKAATDEAAADEATPNEPATRIVTDVWGRQVEIPMNVESIITLGSGAPRLAAYLDVMHMLVGSEAYIEQGVNVLRDYNPVHHAMLMTLPFVGAGGGAGNNNGFPEEIVVVAPDVIIAGFDLEPADELQAQTGIPVISVRHITGLADESFYAAMRVFAEVVGAQERAERVLSYIDSLKEDLRSRTAGIPDSEKLRAYAGAVTWNGRRGILGTYSVFGIFEAIGAYNVAYTPGVDGFFESCHESIIMWNPDVIFLDPGNMDLVNDEYRINPGFFSSLRAVQEGRVYTLPSFNNAGTNITYALINAYFAGTVLFPEQFADVYIAEKAEEILTEFLGTNTFGIMADGGLFFGNITIGE
ncbi:MAG: ABC transporter substrate-binding protein [Oscillospiraceae bacterium]|nr:ABC transporter substrate-binding protein [Oscillospiraceae bacterium]